MLHFASFFFDHWLWHPLVGRGYQFYSGVAGCFLSLSLITGLVAGLRHVNCHVKGCPRLGKYRVEGTPFKVCARHHPTVPDGGASVSRIHEEHRIANDAGG